MRAAVLYTARRWFESSLPYQSPRPGLATPAGNRPGRADPGAACPGPSARLGRGQVVPDVHSDPDYLEVAKKVNRIDLYKQAAAMTRTPLPKDPMRTAKLIDGVVWDAKNARTYAANFKIKVA